MDLTNQHLDTPGRHVNMYHLRSMVAETATCWQAYEAGWHDLEITGSGTRRWSLGVGVIILVMDQAGQVRLSGLVDTAMVPNEAKIMVNGMVQRSIPIEGDRYRPVDGIVLNLEQGPNVIDFVSMRPAIQVEGDSRELSIAVVNLDFHSVESGEICVWREEPAERPESDRPQTTPPARPVSTPTPIASPMATPSRD